MFPEVKIGKAVLSHGFCLAPMAGFTDGVFRRVCREMGAPFTVSEMISAKALWYKDAKTATLAHLASDDTPTAIQLFGHEPLIMERAAEMIAEGTFVGCRYDVPPAVIDINMGCPVRKIAFSGDGSGLMRDASLAAKVTEAVCRGAEKSGIPVTVKIRAGWDEASKNAAEVALAAVHAGASAVFVHGRTRERMYTPPCDLDVISAVRDALPPEIPVFGNGDIQSAGDAAAMMKKTGCDGVMIGRAALSNPWIFTELRYAAEGTSFIPPTDADKTALALRIIREHCEEVGAAQGIKMSRTLAGHLIKGIRGSSLMRDRLNHAETLTEVTRILSGEDIL